MHHPWLLGLVLLGLTLPVWADRTATSNLELHAEAMPTTTLTAEAAQNYRVVPSPERGLLVVTVLNLKTSVDRSLAFAETHGT